MAAPNALLFVIIACYTLSQSGPGEGSKPCGEWLSTMPIDHHFFFGDLGNGDLCFSRSPWKGSGAESSGGTMKTIAGSDLPFRLLTGCGSRGISSELALTEAESVQLKGHSAMQAQYTSLLTELDSSDKP